MSEIMDVILRARSLKTFFTDECAGATSIEYGIIAGSLSIAIVVSVNGIGSQLDVIFTSVKGLF